MMDEMGKKSLVMAILSKKKNEGMEEEEKEEYGSSKKGEHSLMLAAKDVIERIQEGDVEGAAKGLNALVELHLMCSKE